MMLKSHTQTVLAETEQGTSTLQTILVWCSVVFGPDAGTAGSVSAWLYGFSLPARAAVLPTQHGTPVKKLALARRPHVLGSLSVCIPCITKGENYKKRCICSKQGKRRICSVTSYQFFLRAMLSQSNTYHQHTMPCCELLFYTQSFSQLSSLLRLIKLKHMYRPVYTASYKVH